MKLSPEILFSNHKVQNEQEEKVVVRQMDALDLPLIYPEQKRTQVTRKGFIHTTLLVMGEETENDYSWEPSQTATKVNVNMNTANLRGKKGRDLNLHMYVLAEVQARRIPISCVFIEGKSLGSILQHFGLTLLCRPLL